MDKGTLAALQATLLHYARGEAEREVPVWRMIATPLEELAARAADLAAGLRAAGIPATVVQSTSTIGGGALPGETLPTWAVAVAAAAPDTLAAALRRGDPPVVAGSWKGNCCSISAPCRREWTKRCCARCRRRGEK